MIKKIIFAVIVIAVATTVFYQMGWLSYKGEKIYEETKETVEDSINR